jgi:hypothetical protein
VVLVRAHDSLEDALIGLYNEPLAFRRKIRFGTNVMQVPTDGVMNIQCMVFQPS